LIEIQSGKFRNFLPGLIWKYLKIKIFSNIFENLLQSPGIEICIFNNFSGIISLDSMVMNHRNALSFYWGQNFLIPKKCKE